MGKVNITADQLTKNWQAGMTGAVSKIQAGVNAVTESPGVKAAANAQKAATNYALAVSSGRYAAGQMSYTLQYWKTKTAQKVGERMAGGVQAAGAKHAKFAAWLIPALNDVAATVDTMPSMTFQDSINRMTQQATLMHAKKYKS